MHQARTSARAAFTLVEIAIVIVIIGLLTGSMVAGFSYIKNAEIATMMSETKYYTNAFLQFQERYHAVPGDLGGAPGATMASDIWPGVGNGDGNGLIRANGAGGNTAELFYVFQHLAHAGLIDGNYTGLSSDGTTTTAYAKAGVNVPGSASFGVSYLFNHPDALDGNVSGGLDPFYFDGLYTHVLIVAGLTPTGNSLPNVPFLTPKQALALDTKFDDGKPGTGWVMTPVPAALPTCATSNTPSTAVYNTTYNANACYLVLRTQ